MAAPTALGTYYVQETSGKLGTVTDSDKVTVTYTAAAAPTVVDGKTTKNGTIAHYTLDGTYKANKYVAVSTLAEADVVLGTKADMTSNHYLYLKKVPAVAYASATLFNDFGKKCGQSTYPNDTTKTYYLVEENGTKTLKVADTVGDAIVVVDGKVVNVYHAANYETVAHAAVSVVDTTSGKVTGYKCSACGLAAVDAKNAASVPAGATVVAGTTSWYWPAAAAAGTTTVESAKTFDAGIALYAGMALASVAGSAVVIGKKKEF